MKKWVTVWLAFVFALVLSACGGDGKVSNSKLKSDIEQGAISLSVDGEYQELSVNDIVIDRRQTEDREDEIWCSISASNNSYKLRADCYFLYHRYDTGGWQLEDAEYTDLPVIEAPKGVSDTYDSEALELFERSFGDYQLLSEDGFVFEYLISQTSDNCSYSGNVDIEYYLDLISCSDGHAIAYWDHSVSELYNDSCDWDIEGSWRSDIRHSSGSESGYQVFFHLLSFDGSSIEYDLILKYEDSSKEYRGTTKVFGDYRDPGNPVLTTDTFLVGGWHNFEFTWYRDYATIRFESYGLSYLGRY